MYKAFKKDYKDIALSASTKTIGNTRLLVFSCWDQVDI